MQVTFDLPEQLAHRLEAEKDRLTEIIEWGLELGSSGASSNWREVVAFLARGPRPEEIIAYRPSNAHVPRSQELLARNRTASLTPPESGELDEFGRVNHLMMLLKAEARRIVSSAKPRA
jgi:hypothetical protein